MFFYVLAFSPLPAERDFRGRTLLGNSRLAGRCAESGTCDFNGLQRS